MAILISHAKTNTVTDWTQAQLNAQIAAGNFAPGTLLSDIVLPSDWNHSHTITGLFDTANTWTAPQTIQSTTSPQLVLAYDGSHFINFGVGSDGVLTIQNPNVSGGYDVIFPNNVHIGTGVTSSANLAVGGNIEASTGITATGGQFTGNGSGLTNLNLSGYGYATETYVQSYVSGALSFYVTSTDLSNALSNYVTNSSLSSTLTNYVQTMTISGYPNSLGGSSGDIQFNNGSGGLSAVSSNGFNWNGSSLKLKAQQYITLSGEGTILSLGANNTDDLITLYYSGGATGIIGSPYGGFFVKSQSNQAVNIDAGSGALNVTASALNFTLPATAYTIVTGTRFYNAGGGGGSGARISVGFANSDAQCAGIAGYYGSSGDTELGLFVNSVQVLTGLSSGFIGQGTTSPQYLYHAQYAGHSNIASESISSGYFGGFRAMRSSSGGYNGLNLMTAGSPTWTIGERNGNSLLNFYDEANAAIRFSIDTSGNVDATNYYAGGTAPVADGVHVLITGLTQNGSITTKGGIITATQQVI